MITGRFNIVLGLVAMSLARYLAHRARVEDGPPNNGMQRTALRAAADAER